MCKKLLLMCRQNLQNLNLDTKKILGSQNTVFQTTYVPSLPPSVQLYFSITEIKFLLYHAAFCRMKNRRLSFRPNKAQLKLLKLFFFTFLHLEQKAAPSSIYPGPKVAENWQESAVVWVDFGSKSAVHSICKQSSVYPTILETLFLKNFVPFFLLPCSFYDPLAF